jgi:hypothetical protein
MFVENYRKEPAESLMGSGQANPIPYPLIPADDWKAWKLFLPVRQEIFNRQDAKGLTKIKQGEVGGQGIPKRVVAEINKAGDVFPTIEVWRKHKIEKDPIAVGVIGDARYLIARWGEEKLIPFESIKRNVPVMYAWKYITHRITKIVFAAGAGLASWLWLLQWAGAGSVLD